MDLAQTCPFSPSAKNEDELAAELGLGGDGGSDGDSDLEGFGPSFADELEELAQEIESGEGSASEST